MDRQKVDSTNQNRWTRIFYTTVVIVVIFITAGLIWILLLCISPHLVVSTVSSVSTVRGISSSRVGPPATQTHTHHTLASRGSFIPQGEILVLLHLILSSEADKKSFFAPAPPPDL